jgi:hypothetical protein
MKAMVALLLVVWLALASVLAVSPLHDEEGHDHAATHSHTCFLCVLAHGQLLATEVMPVFVVLAVFAFAVALPPLSQVYFSPEFALLPGRAPPLSTRF